jgi:hypothetical protein
MTDLNFIIPLIISLFVVILGIFCAIFPRWVIRVACRTASAYMNEDLTSDITYIYMFRFYGVAAAGLGLYALYQVISH